MDTPTNGSKKKAAKKKGAKKKAAKKHPREIAKDDAIVKAIVSGSDILGAYAPLATAHAEAITAELEIRTVRAHAVADTVEQLETTKKGLIAAVGKAKTKKDLAVATEKMELLARIMGLGTKKR